MDKSKKSQILNLSILAAILFITPLLSSSIRPTYLYFIINILIIALGVEAGLLSSSSKPSENKKPGSIVTSSQAMPDKENPTTMTPDKVIDKECIEKKVEKSLSEKIVVGREQMMNKKVKKCPSMPSLFFIGGGGGETNEQEEFFEDDDYEEEGEEVGDNIGGHEKDPLFNRAEMFIGNFYKQLKMQREDSWKRLQDIYHKAF